MDQRTDNERRQDTPPGREAKSAIGETRSTHSWLVRLRQRRRMVLLVTALLIVALVGLVVWWINTSGYETTDDAFIDARTVSISSQINAVIVDVPVTDNQPVEAGAVLVRLDDRDYKAQLDQSKANIVNIDAQIAAQQARVEQAEKQAAESHANLTFAQQQEQRYTDLVAKGAVTVEQAQQYASGLRQAQANFSAAERNVVVTQKQLPVLQAQRQQAVAQLEIAEANFSRTLVTAPEAGRVTRLTAARGNYASVGQALMMFVPQTVWVTANFKETQLQSVRPGDPVEITVDAYPGRKFKGHVDSIQAGSGTAFSLLPAENATGNYVKIVQRVPVKIVFDRPPDVLLGPGMSAVPSVKARMSEQRHYSGPESRSSAGDRSPWLIAIVVSIATFMVVLDTAIANVALRYIAGSLAVSVDESTWIVTTYLIANAVVLPVSGWLSNVIGRKRFYMLCVALFTIASLLCGLATSLTALIIFRVLQGLGGGGMPTSEQAMLADTFSPRQRPQAFAIYGIAVIVAPTVGPTIGGWITDNYSWHWIFFINVPFGILSLFLVHWLVDEPEVLERERRERWAGGLKVDWVGIILIALIFGFLELVLDRGQIDDWFHSTFIITCAMISGCSFIFFISWELTCENPVVDLRLLFQGQFGMAFIAMLTVGAVLFGSNQITPQLMQTNFPYTAMLSGLAMMPGGLAMLLMMPLAGQIIPRMQPKYWLAIGFTIVALAMWYSTSLTPDASFGYFATVRVFQDVGMPFMFIPINSVAYAGLPPQKTGEASALVNVARNLGGSIGVSLANVELLRRSQFHQSRLVENLDSSSPAMQSALHNLTQYFLQFGGSMADARNRAIGMIGQTVMNQAALMAYIDIFFTWAVIAAALVPFALLLIRQVDQTGGAPVGH